MSRSPATRDLPPISLHIILAEFISAKQVVLLGRNFGVEKTTRKIEAKIQNRKQILYSGQSQEHCRISHRATTAISPHFVCRCTAGIPSSINSFIGLRSFSKPIGALWDAWGE